MALGGTPNGQNGQRRGTDPVAGGAPINGSGGHGGSRRFAFNIGSNFDEARVVQEQIIGEVIARGYGDNDLFALKLALEEAVINAIKHGNKLDPVKRVWVDATVGDEEIDITIKDQGPGFKREDVPDPTLAENLEKNSGRGILLIEAYMTQAEWSDEGRQLHMRKTRESAMAPKA